MAGRRGLAPSAAVVLLLLVVFACQRAQEDRPAAVPAGEPGEQGGVGPPIFIDVAGAAGVDFEYFNGMSGELYMVEMVGGGGALFDYDRDGDLDLYLVQGRQLGPEMAAGSAGGLSDRLYRNDLSDRGGAGATFTDVTEISALRGDGYGQGVAVGDVDRDGWLDVFVTNYGADAMWRNRGDGTFVRTALGSLAGSQWSTSATFVDYDRDGWLDLFVVYYVDATLENHFKCRSASGVIDYCGPLSFEPLADRLLHNRGDGTFEDASLSSGIGAKRGSGLGVIAADLDGDGWPDLYVANDQMANFLWINQGDGTFVERAVVSGCAVSGEGQPEASMGVDAADFDGDGDLDLFLTHLRNETNTLYRNDGRGLFTDVTARSGLGPPSLPFTSFGTRAFDYDNDGWLDLLIANGAVRRIPEQLQAGDPLPLRQPNQLFRNLGGGRFEETTSSSAAALELERVSRGAAFGDVDNDGDTDVVLVHNLDRAQVLLNQTGQERRWLGVRLVEGEPPVDAYGATAALSGRRRRTLWRQVQAGGSFLSSHDPRLLFGLGEGAPGGEELRVLWPDGSEERFTALRSGTYTTLRRGSGTPIEVKDD